MAADTKDRIVNATAELFKRQGYTGTGVKQIVTEAGAPFASLYHFFPGGKEELGAETIRRSGAMYLGLLDIFFDPALVDGDPVVAVRNFFLGAAETLRSTDYADACPIATVALEVASTNESLREATQDVFESWVTGATARFVEFGAVDEAAARAVAMQVIMLLEGAFLLCRASRSTEAMDAAADAAAALVAAVPRRRARRRVR